MNNQTKLLLIVTLLQGILIDLCKVEGISVHLNAFDDYTIISSSNTRCLYLPETISDYIVTKRTIEPDRIIYRLKVLWRSLLEEE